MSMNPKNWPWYVWPILSVAFAPLGTIAALNIEKYALERNWDRLYQLPLWVKIVGVVSENFPAFAIGVSVGIVIWHYLGTDRRNAKATSDMRWSQKSDFSADFSELERLRAIATPEYQVRVEQFENAEKAKKLNDSATGIKRELDTLTEYMKALPSAAQKPSDADIQSTWSVPLSMALGQINQLQSVMLQHGFVHDLSKAPNYDKNHARPVPNENGISDPVKLQEYRRIYDQHKNSEVIASGVITQLKAKAQALKID